MDIRPIIENIEYLKHVYGDCPAEEALDVLKVDALQRIANALEENERNEQTQTKRKPKFTFNDFIEMFNALKKSYRAYPNDRGGVKLVSNHDGDLKANLLPNSCVWALETSDFYPDELSLMAGLAATSPELRGEINYD
ncbi:hypothetical protein ACXO8X_02505 [Lactobacillus delbrueckii subsp. bulgaricus]|nr:hypothetical protein [Lactobacillus delbrueckii subsp. bulgaricus]